MSKQSPSGGTRYSVALSGSCPVLENRNGRKKELELLSDGKNTFTEQKNTFDTADRIHKFWS